MGYVLARLGPIVKNKLLKPSEISKSPERTFPWLTKVSGIFMFFVPLSNICCLSICKEARSFMFIGTPCRLDLCQLALHVDQIFANWHYMQIRSLPIRLQCTLYFTNQGGLQSILRSKFFCQKTFRCIVILKVQKYTCVRVGNDDCCRLNISLPKLSTVVAKMFIEL